MGNKYLTRNFFAKPTLEVMENLIGKGLQINGKSVIITEIEGYIGADDPASHARFGKTKRNHIMFATAGFAYVYLIYGIHHCLNVSTESAEFPAAILFRAGKTFDDKYIDGPGKLCKFFGIDRLYNGTDMINNNCFFEQNITGNISKTARIGIKNGTDKMWRFVLQL